MLVQNRISAAMAVYSSLPRKATPSIRVSPASRRTGEGRDKTNSQTIWFSDRVRLARSQSFALKSVQQDSTFRDGVQVSINGEGGHLQAEKKTQAIRWAMAQGTGV
jgi:hypothetical protein